MTEILTESFCERCGTRYTFESARPRARLKGVRVLSRGLKNFVLSDGTSMDEAMASARSEADRESTAHQLDAFHNTFSFCMSCRQYACANCWNEPEARCLSCAPLALAPGLVEVGDVSQVQVAPQFGDPLQGNGAGEHEHVWGGNGTTEPFAGAEPATEPAMAAEPIVAAEPVVETFVGADPIEAAVEPTGTAEPVRIAESVAATEPGVEVEAVQASESVQADVVVVDPAEPVAAPEPEATPVVPSDPIGKATAQTAGLLRRFRPGQSLDAELAAFERARIEPAAIVEPQPTAPSEDPSTQSGVLGQAPRARPQAEADAIDVVPQPTWQITAPDSTSTTPFPSPVQSPSGAPHQPAPTRPTTPASGEPQWPAKPEWPNSAAAAGLPYLGRPANAVGGIEALWAASNQELATARPTPGRGPTGIQPCVSCGLSLSATARFCRRCGTLQGS